MNNVTRVGILGLSRGLSYINACNSVGVKVVAICDTIKARHDAVRPACPEDVVSYDNFDDFIRHDMDAVILCNYFTEHAPYAIKALRAGKHVLSECTSNVTLAEGVELCRVVEETGKLYMLAENYPFTKSNMEMRRIYQGGSLGRALYCEGEYVHPIAPDEYNSLSPSINHWRNWLPSTYYCTHALAPLMYITDTMPLHVNAVSIAAPEVFKGTARSSCDAAGIMLCRMDNGAIFRITGWAVLGGHGNWYRVSAADGVVESIRNNQDQLLLRYNSWSVPEGAEECKTYSPEWDFNGELAEKAGHGGGDFWVVYHFNDAIQNNKQPYFDVYKGVTMSSLGILAWKSVLANGAQMEIPDFKDEKSRKKYENDYFNPFPMPGSQFPSIPVSTIKGFTPSEEDFESAKKYWAGMDL